MTIEPKDAIDRKHFKFVHPYLFFSPFWAINMLNESKRIKTNNPLKSMYEMEEVVEWKKGMWDFECESDERQWID